MGSLLDGVKNAIVNILDPNHSQNSGELFALRQMYDNVAGQGNMRPRQWYRLHTHSGSCCGFSYVCSGCAREYQLLSAFEWTRDYECSTCHDKFDLYKFAGVTEGKFKVAAKDVESLLATLPVRPRLAGVAPKPRVIDMWEMGWDGSTDYSTADPAGRNGGWV
jgi:DNA-directed RNA polymerase subunit RPC12/RpoP